MDGCAPKSLCCSYNYWNWCWIQLPCLKSVGSSTSLGLVFVLRVDSKVSVCLCITKRGMTRYYWEPPPDGVGHPPAFLVLMAPTALLTSSLRHFPGDGIVHIGWWGRYRAGSTRPQPRHITCGSPSPTCWWNKRTTTPSMTSRAGASGSLAGSPSSAPPTPDAESPGGEGGHRGPTAEGGTWRYV